MKIEIFRNYIGEKQILGTLRLIDGGETIFECKTLELGWKDNKKGESCIPPSPREQFKKYEATVLERSPSFNYKHFWIKDVQNRTVIKIHKGNFYDQILGCILVGDSFYDIDSDGLKDVTNSDKTLNKLMSYFDVGDVVPLTVSFPQVLR
jgi:hypothetical protein